MENITDRELLATYAPVLRFSGGENFFPMNVEDFVGGDTRLYRRVKGKKKAVPEWDSTSDIRERLKMLGKINDEDTYLQYLMREPSSWITRGILILEILILVAAAIYSIFGLSSIYPFVNFDYADIVKLAVLGLLVVIWPLIDADGKAHLGLILILFGIFFFGTAFTLGFAALALGQMVGFWVVYGVFRFWYQRSKLSRKWSAPVLHGISLSLIAVSNIVIGYWFDWLGRGRGWVDGSGYEIPLIITGATILFYSLIIISNALRERFPRDSQRPQEIASIIVMLIALLGSGLIYWFGLRVGAISTTATHLAVIFLVGAILLWYLLDPLSVIKPGLLREDNSRRKVFGWDGRILLVITITLTIYLASSALVIFHQYNDINDVLFAAIFHYAVSAFVILMILGILGDSIPAYFLDVLSGLYNTDAIRARKKYLETTAQRLKLNDPQAARRYWYYGRVVREKEWTILQYNYFYAFNDFRSTAGGMNNHEGDWECVTIFLRAEDGLPRGVIPDPAHLMPFGVAYSQHYHGMFQFWEDVVKAKEKNGRPSAHPIAYAALGSHANYSKAEIYPLSMQFTGTTQRLVNWLEEFIQGFRTRSRLVEKHIREVENALEYYEEKNRSGRIALGDTSQNGTREFAGGDGIRVGYGFYPDWKMYGDELKVVLAPPPAVQRRESNFDGGPASKDDPFDDWAFEVITDDTDWIKFRGLWGRKSRVEGESGPQGPRWSGNNIRVRWSGQTPDYYLEWLDILLFDIVQDYTKPTELRKKAFQAISQFRTPPLEENFHPE